MEVLLPPDFASVPRSLLLPRSSASFVDQSSSYVFPTDNRHQSHPSFPHLTLLVSEAVLEVVVVSALGYIAARKGKFSGEAQKTMANLNIYFFTPCLIFSKLARQLEGDKLLELAIIPVILLAQTLVSYLGSRLMVRLFRIRKQPQINFVTAMAVFGNSNSLPLSLVISLSHTISGLHWDKIPNDNDDEVAARGILYLLIFSQLGQALRWSWGMNSLLKPLANYTREELGSEQFSDTESALISRDNSSPPSRSPSVEALTHQVKTRKSNDTLMDQDVIITDETVYSTASASSSETQVNPDARQRTLTKLPNGDVVVGDAVDDPLLPVTADEQPPESSNVVKLYMWKAKKGVKNLYRKTTHAIYENTVPPTKRAFHKLPPSIQKGSITAWFWTKRFCTGIKDMINVPLAAIIVSVIVATIPSVKAVFYTPGTFVNNTFTSAVNQLGGVAVPLILFILGGNLCRSTQPKDDPNDKAYRKEKKRMLMCAILSRMVIPLVVMAPVLALLAKYVSISILDDPIFLIVCFLLTGAPSALQLAQMCQVNDVYVPVMANLLVHSYVIWIFPSTLVLVLLALEVVEWAKPIGGVAGGVVATALKML